MATEIYTYEAKFNWRTQGTKDWEAPAQADVEAELFPNMESIAIAQFSEQLAKTGHWYRINSVSTSITKFDVSIYALDPMTGWVRYWTDIEGISTVNFDTDIPDATKEGSPQLLEMVAFAIGAIATAIMLHPLLFLTIILVIAFAILASQLTNLTTGVTNFIKLPAGEVIGIIIAVVALVGVVAGVAYWLGQKQK